MSNVSFEEKISFEYHSLGLQGSDIQHIDLLHNTTGYKVRNVCGLPQMTEPQVIKHFTRLSTQNFSIDANFYPLGSCTMKYNPRLNETTARLSGFADIHPMQSTESTQGALRLIYTLKNWLCELTGLYDATLNPAAGAHGEFAGIMCIKKYFEEKGESQRNYIIIPESAHGTNPATAVMCNFKILQVKITKDGFTDLSAIKDIVDKYGNEIAGIMLTNPSTCGLFEKNVKKIADLIHSVGAMFYCDGANFNAIIGKIKPADFGVDVMHFNLHKTFSTPHGGGGPGCGPIAVCEKLSPYLPTPKVIKNDDGIFSIIDSDPRSFGHIKGFYGQFLVMVRALTYIISVGIDGMQQIAEDSVLSANYIQHHLKDYFHTPYFDEKDNPFCMHECLITDKVQKSENGVTTTNVAKVLLENGMHAMTTYFPLVVRGAMLIEPTETESKETIDEFIAVMVKIANQCKLENVEEILSAPNGLFRKKCDDVLAARKPILSYQELISQG
ncbi:MAG: glycine dehydrogenase subunit 2 [Candidatus Deianiraeaceae bacterium]|jgi:glycine dehydrogenase subunit 2